MPHSEASRRFALALVVAFLALLASGSAEAAGAFTVNLNLDAADSSPLDNQCDVDAVTAGEQCTLRAAIQQANASAGPQMIDLPNDTYTLTIIGGDEDAAATGDLDITSDITINGGGASTTVVRAGLPMGASVDRVFHVLAGGAGTLSGMTITRGFPSGTQGGGIVNEGILSVSDATITENSSITSGGGLWNIGTATLTHTLVTSNHGGSSGAAGIKNFGTLTLVESTVSQNDALDQPGGGIANDGALTIQRSSITGNGAQIGGGIRHIGTSLLIEDSDIESNNAVASGGGLALYGPTTIRGSAIRMNSAVDGGGVWVNGTTAYIENSTLATNQASTGGGLFVFGGSGAVLTFDTITGNTASGAPGGGGIAAGFVDGVSSRGSIIAGNEDLSGTGNPDCQGRIVSGGYNLVQTATGCEISGNTTGNILGQNPMLGTAGDHGGPTATIDLLPGSPAINAVTSGCPPPAVDQRGVARQQDACDMGAFEYVPPATPSPTATASPSPSPTPTATPGPLRQGDLNCDHFIDGKDALRPVSVAAGVPMAPATNCTGLGTGDPPFGSVNCDAALDIKDTVAILQYAAGLPIKPTPLPGCLPLGDVLVS